MKVVHVFTFTLLAIFCLLNIQSRAQEKEQPKLKKPGLFIGGNLLYSAPRGNFANSYKGGPGAEAVGGLGYGKTYLVATLGYAHFISRPGVSAIIYKPKKIGIRQYIMGKRLFLNADIATASIRDRSKSVAENHLTRGFGGGVRLLGMEAALYYDGFKNANSTTYSNSLQFKLGWNLGI